MAAQVDRPRHPRSDRPHRGRDRRQQRPGAVAPHASWRGPARRVIIAVRDTDKGERRAATIRRVAARGRQRAAARPRRPGLGSRVRRARSPPTRSPRPADQQRRHHGPAAQADRRRVREPDRHQPPRPLRADRAAAADAAGGAGAPGRDDLERGALDRQDQASTTSSSSTGYNNWRAYGQSKLANLMFCFELQRAGDRRGHARFTSVAAHPGYAATNLQFAGPAKWLRARRHGGRQQGHRPERRHGRAAGAVRGDGPGPAERILRRPRRVVRGARPPARGQRRRQGV